MPAWAVAIASSDLAGQVAGLVRSALRPAPAPSPSGRRRPTSSTGPAPTAAPIPARSSGPGCRSTRATGAARTVRCWSSAAAAATCSALLLSSQDHDRDAADEARHGRIWTDIGSGPWDSRRRPSEVRLDRLLVLDPATVRREGAALDRARFDRVVAEARRVQGW